ncbi:hypothetical protein T492DRAFT_854564, partial [Pavlovales sp. CCMP2436]
QQHTSLEPIVFAQSRLADGNADLSLPGPQPKSASSVVGRAGGHREPLLADLLKHGIEHFSVEYVCPQPDSVELAGRLLSIGQASGSTSALAAELGVTVRVPPPHLPDSPVLLLPTGFAAAAVVVAVVAARAVVITAAV